MTKNIMDKESSIYIEVKKEADNKFDSPTGIYKSAWIVREYKKRGGKFIGSKESGDKKSKKSDCSIQFSIFERLSLALVIQVLKPPISSTQPKTSK